jgi:hypothetical protein
LCDLEVKINRLALVVLRYESYTDAGLFGKLDKRMVY